MSQAVILYIDRQVAHIRLNRADKHNALNMEMFEAIANAQKQVAKNRGLRAIILSGEGVDFCTGLDVKSVMKNRSGLLKLLWKWLPWQSNLAQRVSTGWRKIPVPVIAAVQGRCWGGGLQIALGADFRFASPDTSFSIMEGKWGLIPDMAGNLALRELVTKDIALKLTMTAEVISAPDALGYGLITDVSDEPLQLAKQLTEQINERSPDAVAAVKKLYQRNWFKAEWVMLAKESYYQLRILVGKNQNRAVKRQLKPEDNIMYTIRSKW